MRKKNLMKTGLAVALAVMTLAQPVSAANWVHNNVGWWWQEDNGSYPADQWKAINGKWYWFDSNGYMATGWRNIGGKWYWFEASGAMVTGWRNINGTWYYMDSSGSMAANRWIGNYYVEADGAMATNKWIGNYYVNGSGLWTQTRMPAQWIHSGNRWWYRHADGSYTRNGWETIGGRDYYFDSDGWMLTGWKNLNGQWYYLESSGEKATNKWIGNYYVESNGVMATNKWIGNYYVNGSGLWVETKCQHNYDGGVVTTAATCGKEGIKTFTCKTCGDSYTETLPMLTHNWVHHEAEGHYETVIIKEATKEPIWESITICNDCGKQFTGPNQADDCGLHTLECDGPTGSYHTEENLIGYKDIPAVAEDRWVVDTLAYDACSVCGFKK